MASFTTITTTSRNGALAEVGLACLDRSTRFVGGWSGEIATDRPGTAPTVAVLYAALRALCNTAVVVVHGTDTWDTLNGACWAAGLPPLEPAVVRDTQVLAAGTDGDWEPLPLRMSLAAAGIPVRFETEVAGLCAPSNTLGLTPGVVDALLVARLYLQLTDEPQRRGLEPAEPLPAAARWQTAYSLLPDPQPSSHRGQFPTKEAA